MFVTRKWAPAMGGMETYCLRLTEELAKTHRLEIAALPGNADGSPPSAVALLWFPFKVLRQWMALSDAPDVIHVADMALWPAGLLARKRNRVILSAHGTDVSYPRRGGIRGRLYGAYLKLGSKLLPDARVIANSSATEAACHENGWQRTAIVALATDISRITPSSPPRRTILFAGRLVRRKGLRWFVENVLDRLPAHITLEVAGTRWDAAEETALDHRRVRYLGKLDPEGLAEAYGAALCVVLPNLELANGEFEGFGLIACEAASAGGIVLAADCGGLSEAVIGGETGFLLPSGDADAWADKIADLNAWSPEARAGFIGRSIAASATYYSWGRVVRETAALYRNEFEPTTQRAEN
nr:glycosyltransferase family 4 protein [Allopontixanthobacter sediminis]